MINDLDFCGEAQYFSLLSRVITIGQYMDDRTGIGSFGVFDGKIYYDSGEFPFMVTRSVPTRLAFEEFWFFIRGETQTKELEKRGVNFWKGNTSREFLDARGLSHLPEGDYGKAYGYQFRHNPDQLIRLYEGLRDDPYGRRHYVTFWNPNELDEMALTPCHHSHQFVCIPSENNRPTLHLKVINRSLDIVFGYSFAAQQYRLYQIAMADLLGYDVGDLSFDLSQVHVYKNQLNYALEMVGVWCNIPDVTNDDYDIRRVQLNKKLTTLDELINLTWGDWSIVPPKNYESLMKTKKPKMAV